MVSELYAGHYDGIIMGVTHTLQDPELGPDFKKRLKELATGGRYVN